MKILITGSTGLIGKQLLDHLKGHELVLLTRNIEKAQSSLAHLALPHVNFISDLSSLSDLNNIDTVINLAGEPIADKKWTRKQKKIISDSRCKLTEQLAQLCLASTPPPRCFISGSAIGYYGDNGQKDIDEDTKIVSADFAHQVCQQWENKALQVQSKNTRVCILRTGVVLSPLGGALKKMLLPYKFGLGGPVGNGKQYLSWIHIDDMVYGILHLMTQEESQGIYNLTAPHPVSNRLFSQTLAKTLKRPHFLFTPNIIIKGILGEASVLLTDSQRVRPKRLVHEGFKFRYSRIESALKQLLS
ncbi:TIGR01777 family oxidoreductase [Aliivibrio sp. S4TY2]|uniref:TIGR01777 family oxidoreductase n=1 Tax=unclassified Aliivibrio TaxID=2645654 RepID=UPI0023799173|nr:MULTISPECIES: TIGR01777 family oxidoreductase [unclassified Aliivibrio]MDD9156442.1 TIGR01777 family oxidoreductase [Aliivibrio sp. S4TY2]MDD9160121.1 TIGR01777 family oxidoreductase [Aliivibrio sp. S4TY1]MDD9164343.1 TIGR01777 family oxidoreductase [Aliivibrio sp. S4MY2]MDD9168149.1 TIGR01777 family oxidoreductase [Aliivibrio sp. S4MY4]MDD9184485.1 TIGR01777 family oxidoreductase [Aliivibrio sp. S4MY3]